MATPLASVVSGGGRVLTGRGLVANQDIMKGTVILTNIGKNIWKANPNAFFASERAGTTSKISAAVNTLSPMDRASFNRLFKPAGPGNVMVQMVDRFEYNAFNFVGSSHKMHLVLYHIACYINHSCVPNATADIGQDISQYPRGQIRLVATQNIPRDSEIFFNYIADDWKKDSVLRGNELQQQWHFACLCTGCTPLQAPLDTIERHMAVAYSDNLPDPAVLPALPEIARHIDRLGTYIHLLGTLGIWDDKLTYACMLLANLHESKSDWRKAMHCAIAGLLVEQHAYYSVHTQKLNEVLGRCYVRDPSLRAEYERASLGPYPLG